MEPITCARKARILPDASVGQCRYRSTVYCIMSSLMCCLGYSISRDIQSDIV